VTVIGGPSERDLFWSLSSQWPVTLKTTSGDVKIVVECVRSLNRGERLVEGKTESGVAFTLVYNVNEHSRDYQTGVYQEVCG
jgi:hypothetical protein